MGFLFRNHATFEEVREILQSVLGPEEEIMSPRPFHWSPYYEKELGGNCLRSFISFEPLQKRESITWIKQFSCYLEEAFSHETNRSINLDPGYLTLGQFFLSTTKDQRQRIHLAEGVYMEPTLYYKDGQFNRFPWTYPDYASGEYFDFLQAARSKFAYQQRNGKPYSQRMKTKEPPLGYWEGS